MGPSIEPEKLKESERDKESVGDMLLSGAILRLLLLLLNLLLFIKIEINKEPANYCVKQHCCSVSP